MEKITYNLFVRSESSTSVWVERTVYVSATQSIEDHGKNLVKTWNEWHPEDPRVFVNAVLLKKVNFHHWERINLTGKSKHRYVCLKCKCEGKAHILDQVVQIEYKNRKYADYCPKLALNPDFLFL